MNGAVVAGGVSDAAAPHDREAGRWLLLLALVLAALGACGKSGVGTFAVSAEVSARVTSPTGEPIQGAWLLVVPRGLDGVLAVSAGLPGPDLDRLPALASGTTDDQGRVAVVYTMFGDDHFMMGRRVRRSLPSPPDVSILLLKKGFQGQAIGAMR